MKLHKLADRQLEEILGEPPEAIEAQALGDELDLDAVYERLRAMIITLLKKPD